MTDERMKKAIPSVFSLVNTALALLAAICAAFVYLSTYETRIATLEANQESIFVRLEEQRQDNLRLLGELKKDLRYIRDRVDERRDQ